MSAATARRPRMLEIAPGLRFDIEYVTKTAAILAQRRKGKTYLGAVIAEELIAAKLPWVALDPTGAWWGLRSSADGENPGLPVVVIGGQHGDLPLERDSGVVVADLVLDHPGWYVIDFSLLGSRAAEREFAATFGDRLHRRKMEPGLDFPLHLFVDEADLFVPQEKETVWSGRRRPGDPPDILAVYQGIVRRGGLHGLGSTLISQRPALVNKNALTQIDILFLLRLVAGQDQEAVYKNNVSRFLPKREALDLMATLATLPIGEGWALEPGADPPLCERVRFRERRTFNSSATPKPGEKRVEPRVLAEVDLDALRGRMAAAIERARDDDPVFLHRRLKQLEAELAKAHAAPNRPADPEIVEVPIEVEVPVVSDSDRALAREVIEAVQAISRQTEALPGFLTERLAPFAAALERVSTGPVAPARLRTTPRREPPAPVAERTGPQAAPEPGESDGARLSSSQQRILDALRWFEEVGVDAVRRPPLGAVAGASAKSSGFRANVSTLSGLGLICYPSNGCVGLTEEGRARAAAPSRMPTAEALQEAVYAMLSGPQADLLRVLVAMEGQPLSREELAARAGVSALSSGFRANVSTLSGWEMVTYPAQGLVAAADLLFLR